MSLIDTLTQQGFTIEDLEKAASVRIFEKVAEAEQFDLSTLSEVERETLYEKWLNGAPAEPAKEASSKVASAEEVEEAGAKLAEAELLGRHMARAFVDENQKIASAMEAAKGAAKGAAGQAADFVKNNKKAVGAGAAATVIGTGGAALLKKKMTEKKMEKEGRKEASAFDELAAGRAVEILEANGLTVSDTGEIVRAEIDIDAAANAGAWEMLGELGFTHQE